MTDRLRKARAARGWSQDRLIHEMERYACEHLADIASTASLRVYVSEWENQRRPVSPRYAAILRPLMGLTDEELFGDEPSSIAPADGYTELISRIDSARSVGVEMVETFMSQTELFRSMDRQMGAASLVDQMSGHLATLEETLTFAVLPDARRPLARALAGASTLAAWQALDAGAIDRAWRNYELGKRAAQEADEPLYLAHAKGEQANVLADAGRPELGVSLVREARQSGGSRLSPRLTAWLLATEAELCARAGEHDEARRALDAAAKALPAGDEPRDPDMPSVFLNDGHLARWRGNVLTAVGDDEAMSSCYEALAALDPTFVRASSRIHADLARAHLARGENAEARKHLQRARLIVNRTGSVRERRRLDQIAQETHTI